MTIFATIKTCIARNLFTRNEKIMLGLNFSVGVTLHERFTISIEQDK